MTNSFTERGDAKWSLSRLVKAPHNAWGMWTSNQKNTQLCFSCWAIWHGQSDEPNPEKTSSNCPCCKLIAIVLRSEGIVDKHGWYAVLQFQGKGIKSLLKSHETVLDERESGRTPLFLELYLKEDWVHKSAIWVSYESNDAYSRRRACSTPTITFDIPDQVSQPLLRSWISECDNHGHFPGGSTGDNSRSQEVHKIFLIDVRQQMLVHCSLAPEQKMATYFALSYVWGPTNFFKTTKSNVRSLLLPGGLAAPHVQLPKTFLDAMRLVDLLGGRYIWIDALCIIQDGQMKHNQLQIMDQIYGRAYMTIVCLAGNSAHAGLPGLDANTRIRRPIACRIGEGVLYEGLPSLERAIRGSTHYTRAWTFQETFVSKKCLFISEGQFFYRCYSNRFHAESLDRQAEIPSNQELELELGLMPDWWRSENAFFSSVENYTKRTLSHDEDIIDAFSGALERMKEMGYQPQGDLTMDITSANSLLWFSVDKNATRRSTLPSSGGTMYPTWSWTGWRGAVTYASLKFGRNASFRTVSLRWSHRYKPAGADCFHSLEAERDERTESKELCAQPYCLQLLTLARGEPRFKDISDERYPDLRHLSLYRFRTSVCTMLNFACCSRLSYVHRRSTPHIDVTLVGIHDRNGKRCGFLFNPPEFDPPLSSLHNEVQHYFLVTVSMKKQHNWLENIPGMDHDTGHWPNVEKECSCCLNIMLVRESEEHDGLVERIAVGQMNPQAWAEAEPIVATVTMM